MCDGYKIDPNKKIPKETLDAIEKAMQQPLLVKPLTPHDMYPNFVLVPQADFDNMIKELEHLKSLQLPTAVENLAREIETLKQLNAKYQERADTAEAELKYLEWHPMTEIPEPWVDVIIRDANYNYSISFHTGQKWACSDIYVAWCRARKEKT